MFNMGPLKSADPLKRSSVLEVLYLTNTPFHQFVRKPMKPNGTKYLFGYVCFGISALQTWFLRVWGAWNAISLGEPWGMGFGGSGGEDGNRWTLPTKKKSKKAICKPLKMNSRNHTLGLLLDYLRFVSYTLVPRRMVVQSIDGRSSSRCFLVTTAVLSRVIAFCSKYM